MGMYKYLQKTWKSREFKEEMKKRLILWRKQPTILRIDHPTRLDRAHSLGYKAKQGFIVVRTRIGKGTGKRKRKVRGGKPSKAGQYSMPSRLGHKRVAEMRTARKFPNCEVLNSYYVAEDGRTHWFEVILVDPNHPAIKNNPKYNWICQNKGRAFRGKTSAAKGSRMLDKGIGFERRGNPKKR